MALNPYQVNSVRQLLNAAAREVDNTPIMNFVFGEFDAAQTGLATTLTQNDLDTAFGAGYVDVQTVKDVEYFFTTRDKPDTAMLGKLEKLRLSQLP